MCFKLYALGFVAVVLGSIGVDAAPKDTMISKIKTLVTTFATDIQLSKVVLSSLVSLSSQATGTHFAFKPFRLSTRCPTTCTMGLLKRRSPTVSIDEFLRSPRLLTDMLSVVLTSLSGTQLLKGLDINTKITTQLGGQAKAQATLDKIHAVVGNNVQDIYDQVRLFLAHYQESVLSRRTVNLVA